MHKYFQLVKIPPLRSPPSVWTSVYYPMRSIYEKTKLTSSVDYRVISIISQFVTSRQILR
ncbi:hypothetical protein THIOM_005190 [Candidatus Thiomargarita nelsonii]|uniref:Uncharacterized protein n=1 Tax=Candidatus Thiomargarita nelsonii TaxID=1003181 RepID=A0A176RTW8_9GAMM|nr:hypothetical protein THIOM_005190 [Candidatus Thiomargarita nelsonii]